jgi:hypothetical protein
MCTGAETPEACPQDCMTMMPMAMCGDGTCTPPEDLSS